MYPINLLGFEVDLLGLGIGFVLGVGGKPLVMKIKPYILKLFELIKELKSDKPKEKKK